jgi:hypothetical protein
MRSHRLLTLVVSSFLLFACSDDDNDEPVVVDLNGSWTFLVDVTVANGVCAGEEDATPEPFPVNFVVVDPNGDGTYDVTVDGDFGDTDAGGTMSGTVTGVPEVGDVIVLSGDVAEDGGITTSTYTLTVQSATRLTGTEEWSWTGTGGTCPDGQANVQVSKVTD